MIRNKSKIQMAISNIQKFLTNFNNQPSDLQKGFKKSLLQMLKEKDFSIEVESEKTLTLFRFKGEDITLTKVEFVKIPFLEKNDRFSHSSHLTNWTFFKSIPKDEFWVSLVELENGGGDISKILLEILLGKELSQSEKDKINLFFNIELKKNSKSNGSLL